MSLIEPLVKEIIYTICGPEFGEYMGNTTIIVWELEGIKSSGAYFRNHLADFMRELGCISCLSDLDVWMESETQENGYQYYSYCMLYVDDVLMMHQMAEEESYDIDHQFIMNKISTGYPEIYAGENIL